MENVIKYAQGTIWHWSEKEKSPNEIVHHKAGVQSSNRPVLIISNNKFNTFSPVVNCVTVTTTLNDSPVHIPIKIFELSHIQCEQIRTLPKSELFGYKGTVSSSTMAEVKKKLRLQFDMSYTETEGLQEIERVLQEINSKISHALSDSGNDNSILNALNGLMSGIDSINDSFVARVQTYGHDTKKNRTGCSKETVSNAICKKKPYRIYSEEDEAYIMDNNNSLDEIRRKYNYRDNIAAGKARSYLRNRAKSRVF